MSRFHKLGTLAMQRRAACSLMISQALIVFTGSVVRVTGSGLGCPTWPNCQEDSLVPVAGARPAIHQAIEFGNRLLTFVLAAFAVWAIIAVYSAARRKDIKVLAWVQLAGIGVQAVIGGISVLLDLRWWAVAAHFLPSMILVWLAAVLWVRIDESDDSEPRQIFPRPLQYLAALTGAALALVLITGTMTTGAGPHAGDDLAGQQGRLNVDIAEMAHVHAHFMYLFLGLTIGLVIALYTVNVGKHPRRIGFWLIAMIVVQGAIGIIQYRFGVPTWTVPVHVGLSGAVVGITGCLYAHGRRRSPNPGAKSFDKEALV
ncbi:MAG: COX15/CtaA family protein [Corynebacterium sp.]|nr:COX15/CtaA family protein [Corynebacterium sp.]